MKTILRASLFVLSLLFVNVISATTVLADSMGYFRAQGEIILGNVTIQGVDRVFVGQDTEPPCRQVEIGTGKVLQCVQANGHIIPGTPSETRVLTLGPVEGRAGPEYGFGFASANSSGITGGVRYTNNMDTGLFLNPMVQFSFNLLTQISGDGLADANFFFSILDQNNTILFTHIEAIFGNNMRMSSGMANVPFFLPANGSVTLRIEGGVSGVAAVPEPTTLLLLGTGLAGVAASVRRRRRGSKGEVT